MLITTPRIHLRGLDRNGVVVDGTKPGSPQCSSAPARPGLRPAGPTADRSAATASRSSRPDGVTVENLTVCNFLDGAGGGGNQIWFNGGDGSGQVGMGPFRGDLPLRDLDATTAAPTPPPAPTGSSPPTPAARA